MNTFARHRRCVVKGWFNEKWMENLRYKSEVVLKFMYYQTCDISVHQFKGSSAHFSAQTERQAMKMCTRRKLLPG